MFSLSNFGINYRYSRYTYLSLLFLLALLLLATRVLLVTAGHNSSRTSSLSASKSVFPSLGSISYTPSFSSLQSATSSKSLDQCLHILSRIQQQQQGLSQSIINGTKECALVDWGHSVLRDKDGKVVPFLDLRTERGAAVVTEREEEPPQYNNSNVANSSANNVTHISSKEKEECVIATMTDVEFRRRSPWNFTFVLHSPVEMRHAFGIPLQHYLDVEVGAPGRLVTANILNISVFSLQIQPGRGEGKMLEKEGLLKIMVWNDSFMCPSSLLKSLLPRGAASFYIRITTTNFLIPRREVHENIERAAVAVMSLAAVMGNPALAIQVNQAAGLLASVECFFSNVGQPLDPRVNLFDFAIGPGEHGQYYRGALVGSLLTFVLISFVYIVIGVFGITFVRFYLMNQRCTTRSSTACSREQNISKMRPGEDTEEEGGKEKGSEEDAESFLSSTSTGFFSLLRRTFLDLHFPGVLIIPFAVIVQGVSSASVSLSIHGSTALDDIMSTVGMVAVIVFDAWVIFIVIFRKFPCRLEKKRNHDDEVLYYAATTGEQKLRAKEKQSHESLSISKKDGLPLEEPLLPHEHSNEEGKEKEKIVADRGNCIEVEGNERLGEKGILSLPSEVTTSQFDAKNKMNNSVEESKANATPSSVERFFQCFVLGEYHWVSLKSCTTESSTDSSERKEHQEGEERCNTAATNTSVENTHSFSQSQDMAIGSPEEQETPKEDASEGHLFMKKYAAFFVAYRLRWFLGMELLVGTIFGIVDGIRISQDSACSAQSTCLTVFMFFLFLICLVTRPAISQFENVFVIILYFTGFVASLLVTIELFLPSGSSASLFAVAQIFVVLLLLLSMAKFLFFDLVVWAVWAKRHKQEILENLLLLPGDNNCDNDGITAGNNNNEKKKKNSGKGGKSGVTLRDIIEQDAMTILLVEGVGVGEADKNTDKNTTYRQERIQNDEEVLTVTFNDPVSTVITAASSSGERKDEAMVVAPQSAGSPTGGVGNVLALSTTSAVKEHPYPNHEEEVEEREIVEIVSAPSQFPSSSENHLNDVEMGKVSVVNEERSSGADGKETQVRKRFSPSRQEKQSFMDNDSEQQSQQQEVLQDSKKNKKEEAEKENVKTELPISKNKEIMLMLMKKNNEDIILRRAWKKWQSTSGVAVAAATDSVSPQSKDVSEEEQWEALFGPSPQKVDQVKHSEDAAHVEAKEEEEVHRAQPEESKSRLFATNPLLASEGSNGSVSHGAAEAPRQQQHLLLPTALEDKKNSHRERGDSFFMSTVLMYPEEEEEEEEEGEERGDTSSSEDEAKYGGPLLNDAPAKFTPHEEEEEKEEKEEKENEAHHGDAKRNVSDTSSSLSSAEHDPMIPETESFHLFEWERKQNENAEVEEKEQLHSQEEKGEKEEGRRSYSNHTKNPKERNYLAHRPPPISVLSSDHHSAPPANTTAAEVSQKDKSVVTGTYSKGSINAMKRKEEEEEESGEEQSRNEQTKDASSSLTAAAPGITILMRDSVENLDQETTYSSAPMSVTKREERKEEEDEVPQVAQYTSTAAFVTFEDDDFL